MIFIGIRICLETISLKKSISLPAFFMQYGSGVSYKAFSQHRFDTGEKKYMRSNLAPSAHPEGCAQRISPG